MSEPQRGISPEDHARIVTALGARNLRCGVCANKTWNLVPEIVGTPVYRNDEMTWGSIPMIALLCKGCGYVMFFSAATLGLGKK